MTVISITDSQFDLLMQGVSGLCAVQLYNLLALLLLVGLVLVLVVMVSAQRL